MMDYAEWSGTMILKNTHNQIQNELALQMDCGNLILVKLHACLPGQSQLKHIFVLVDMHAKLTILDFYNPFVMQVHFGNYMFKLWLS